MNLLLEEGLILASEVENMTRDEVNSQYRIIICPPLTYLNPIRRMIKKGSPLGIGAQNCHFEPKGAFTGEVSAPMLNDMGVEYAIVGHSERRTLMGDSDDVVKSKLDSVLASGMTPIFCCGESLEVRESGNFLPFILDQVRKGLFHLDDSVLENVILAYEPIWAIGTGKTAVPEQAQEVHQAIRSMIQEERGEVAKQLTILYGGSCNENNAADLFSCQDVDGGLIGGASLKARSFIEIAKSF